MVRNIVFHNQKDIVFSHISIEEKLEIMSIPMIEKGVQPEFGLTQTFFS